jgi:CarboxypepD_reg-like domain/TonB dependent receptor
MKKILLSMIWLLCSVAIFAQLKQNIKGNVIDKDTRQPLIGATIILSDVQPAMGVATDENGNFTIKDVPVGRHKIECGYLGYSTFSSENIILNSAKELVLNIELIEAVFQQQQEVVVKAFKNQGNRALNEAAVLSSRSFSVEETQRAAASANDPARMAMGFPGVQANRDSRSDIVIRGNSGIGLLWRLEGIDIPNPNHFARIGSSGGGLTIFSTNMLATSDFMTGAYPAEYGNSFSGVFDMKFRKGNQEKTERTIKAGLLGLEYAQEGPFSKKSRASYLFSYRYSTLSILNRVGLYLVGKKTSNDFQDLSFNIYLPIKNGKSIVTLFGLGGLSGEKEKAGDSLTTFAERSTYDFNTNMGAVGLTHFYLINEKSYLKTTVALMNQLVTTNDYYLNKNFKDTVTLSKERHTDGRLSLSTFYSYKFNPKVALKTGVNVSYLFFDFSKNIYGTGSQIIGINSVYAKPKNPILLQPYINFRISPMPKLSINAGLHAMYFSLHNENATNGITPHLSKYSIEPRINMRYQVADNQSISLAYGRHGKILPLGSYYNFIGGGIIPSQNYSNTDLDIIKADHYVAAYEIFVGKATRVRAEAYYQSLFNVPVSPEMNDTYSLINNITGFAERALVSKGHAMNKGIELSIEQGFQGGAFFTASTSIYRSTYQPLNGNTYSTQYDSRVQANFIGGKELKLKKNNVLQIGTKIIYNGGLPLNVLKTGVVQKDGKEPIYDETKPYSERNKAYFRPDLRIAYRKDKVKSAYTLALDIQNVAAYRNQDGLSRIYDAKTNTWTYRKQSGLVPVISYQVDF